MDRFSSVKQDTQWHLTPGHTAVLVVDMVNDFLTEGGKMVLPGGMSIVPCQQALIAAARSAGLPIVYVNDAHRPGLVSTDREFRKRGEHCIEGTWGAAVIDDLVPQEGDLQVTKRRFSGFFNTDLDLTLKDVKVDTLIVMGVVTNICVRSTIHDAFFHGYSVIVPRDCVAATGPREQESTLYDISTHFGEVTDSKALIKALARLEEESK
ncbi:MAG: cysteine hydrolase [Deltaproteobacteria bacterium]|nr:cysteine hydrolase [Deltaproteobacteria bacterium]